MDDIPHKHLADWDQFVSEVRDDRSPEATSKLRTILVGLIVGSERAHLDKLVGLISSAIDRKFLPPMFYTLVGAGHALRSNLVVRDVSEDGALGLAQLWAVQNGLDPKSFQVVSERPDEGGPEIVYGWNGDY